MKILNDIEIANLHTQRTDPESARHNFKTFNSSIINDNKEVCYVQCLPNMEL